MILYQKHMPAQSRYWCFTLNNPTRQLFLDGRYPDFAIWQYERGASGTAHFQGYVEFGSVKRLQYVARFIGGGCHVEPRHGSQVDAIRYCTKEEGRVDGPWRVGEPTADVRGRHTGLVAFAARLRDGVQLGEAARQDPSTYARNCRGLRELARLYHRRAWRNVVGFYLWGATGTGKSSLVYDTFGTCVRGKRSHTRTHSDSRAQDTTTYTLLQASRLFGSTRTRENLFSSLTSIKAALTQKHSYASWMAILTRLHANMASSPLDGLLSSLSPTTSSSRACLLSSSDDSEEESTSSSDGEETTSSSQDSSEEPFLRRTERYSL